MISTTTRSSINVKPQRLPAIGVLLTYTAKPQPRLILVDGFYVFQGEGIRPPEPRIWLTHCVPHTDAASAESPSDFSGVGQTL